MTLSGNRPPKLLLAMGVMLVASQSHAAEPNAQRLRERFPEQQQSPTLRSHQDRQLNTPADAAEPASSDDQTFLAQPTKIVVTGSTAMPRESLDPILAPYIGQKLSRKSLGQLAKDLTDFYRAQGYFLARATIPVQQITDGVLTVNISEGAISEIECDNSTCEDLKPYFNELLGEKPARRETMERALLIVGDISGIDVKRSRTAPIENHPGEFRLVISIERDAGDGLIYLDNRGSGGGDAVQSSGQFAVNDVLQTGGRVEVNVFTDPANPTSTQLGQITATMPIGLRGSYATVLVSASGSNVDEFGSGQRFTSRGTELALSLSHPIVRTRAESLWVNFNVAQANDYSDFEGFAIRKDELFLLRAGLNYQLKDGWDGQNRVNLETTLGRDEFKTAMLGDLLASPEDGATFTKLNLTVSRVQKISNDWSLLASARGQYTADALPSGERISFGGARWGRAYDYSEIEGDTGVAGQLELRYDIGDSDYTKNLQAYVFGDTAAVWDFDGIGKPVTLSSSGFGVRTNTNFGVRASVEVALPLTRTPDGQDNRDPRIFMMLSKQF